jgi:hypothetical protein
MGRKTGRRLSDIVDSKRLKNAQQILCKVVATQAIPYTYAKCLKYKLQGTGFSLASTVGKNPLRMIVARTPIAESVWNGTHESIWYLDTLECGHQVAIFPFSGPPSEKRHRCVVCGESQLALKFPKKPSHPVPLNPKKERTS